MKNPFSQGSAGKPKTVHGLQSVPPGAQMIPVEVKRQYERNPVHIYHPTPYTAVTVLKGKKEPHEWLVCGWYLDTYRDHGLVKGLVYRVVEKNEDKEQVLAELKKLDKDANVKFAV